MVPPELIRETSAGVTLLGDPHRPGGVTLAFTERTGGVSTGSYASLNLDDACGDDPAAVEKNRRRALDAVGAAGLYDALVCPRQVHGSKVVVVGGDVLGVSEAQLVAAEGADAIVCLQKDVPVLLCFADCVPVILVAEGAFAVVHSGWRGTVARIAAKALRVLVGASGTSTADVHAYIGPHVGAGDYEVSPDLAQRFANEFGPDVVRGRRNVDLALAVSRSLVEEGVGQEAIACVEESTASNTHRFFSYRAEQGKCGRHGALACMVSDVA